MRSTLSTLLVATVALPLPFAHAQSGLVLEENLVTAVSANGQFVAGYSPALDSPVIFSLASGDVAIDGQNDVRGVSDDGAVAISTAGVWSASGGLVQVPGPTGSTPIDISADGSIVLVRQPGSTSASLIDFWIWNRTTGTNTPLERPAGTILTTASALSSDGSTALGVTTYPPNADVAVRWDTATGAATVIGSVTDPGSTAAIAASADGSWITGSYVVPGQPVGAFRWSAATGLVPLPPASQPGGVNGRGRWISRDGRRIVTVTVSSDSAADSFVWEEGQATRTLGDWLAGRGAVPMSGTLAFTNASDELTTLAVARQLGPFLFDGFPSVWLDAEVSTSFCGPAVPNSTGASAELRLLGSDEIGAATLVLRASGLVPFQAALPVTSRQAAFVPGAGGSAGNLCLGGPIGRFAVVAADAAGGYEFDVDDRALPRPNGPVAAMAGETWHFQVWFRDPTGGGSNFTDGARLLFR